MIKQLKTILGRYVKKKKIVTEIPERAITNETDNYDISVRKYKNIPLYTEEEMEKAPIDDSDEVRYECLGRQVINGYVGLYKGKWIVGRRRDGCIVKTCKDLLFDSLDPEKEKRNRYILEVQNKALLGEDIANEIFCKFTYDIEKQDIFALHVTLEREYVENEIIEDSGTYGGIHFVHIDNIDLCANKENTYYGNKIALLKPISDEVYYEYMEDTFVGNKVYITKVMYLSSVETWKYLSQLTVSLREHKEKLCQYLKGLENLLPEEDYTSSIKFIEEL